LTEVNGKAILINALEKLETCGVEETILVVGYMEDKIKERIGNSFGKMKISYVTNEIYDKTNTSFSLWLGLKDLEIEDSLLVLEGDVFFEEQLLKTFIEEDVRTSTVVQKYNPNLDGSFVALNGNLVIDWIHKKVRKPDFVIEDKFKTVNIHKFDKEFVANVLKPVLKNHVEAKEGIEPIEYVMQDIVANKKGEVLAFKTGVLKWFEIDDVKELKIAEEMFR